MSIETYTFSSPSLRYSCPPGTPSTSAWRTLDLAPEMDRNSGNTKLEVKATDGPGCTDTFGGWKASEAWVRGWLTPEDSTWCCALDSTDYTCYSAGGDWETVELCGYAGLDPDKEHTISITSSPAGHSRLLIDSAYSNSKSPDEVKTTDLATIATAVKPASVDLETYYQTTSTTSSSSSSPPAATSTSPSSNDASESTTSSEELASASQATHSPGGPASTNSNALFLVIAVGILAVVVVCIVTVLCLRTEAKPGRVEVRKRRKEERVGEELLKRVDLERGRHRHSIRKERTTRRGRESAVRGEGTPSSTSDESGAEHGDGKGVFGSETSEEDITSDDNGKKDHRRVRSRHVSRN